MNEPISTALRTAVTAPRQAKPVPASTLNPTPPPASPIRAADSVSISDAGRLRSSMQAGTQSSNLVTAQPGDAPMNKGERIMADMKANFMTRQGDEGFDSKLDFNGDGVINAGDLGMLREKMMANGMLPAPVADEPPAAASVDSIRDAFFKRAGEDGFDTASDLNGDGIINAGDLAMLRQSQESAGDDTQPVPFNMTNVGDDTSAVASTALGVAPETTPAVETSTQSASINVNATAGLAATDADGANPALALSAGVPASTRQEMLDALREAFFSRTGDQGFNAALDGNGDGILNFADLMSIRDRA